MDCWVAGWLLGWLASWLGHWAAGLAGLAWVAGRSDRFLASVGRNLGSACSDTLDDQERSAD